MFEPFKFYNQNQDSFMRLITEKETIKILTYKKLIDALHQMYRSDYQMPLRHHHFYPAENDQENTLILMPSWNEKYLGNKQIILAPGNTERKIPTVSALYSLFDVETGTPLCIMEAGELTARRTACKSALAAQFLAPEDAKTLLVMGGGRVAQHLIPAHCGVRDYQNIEVWLRNPDKFESFKNQLPQELQAKVKFAPDLQKAVSKADVISAATMTVDPLIKGEWIKKGCYLDLVGSYKPHMREADDAVIQKSQIFVDSREGALHETGEMAIPIKEGLLQKSDIRADLTELCRGQHPGRTSADETILFKSAGLAIEDLAGAIVVYESLQK